ncbi:MAG TPA: 3-oxoacyl-ACP reductase FabG [Candidatus Azoamicus sp. OHIO1]
MNKNKKIAIVTGASRGIGKEIAKKLSSIDNITVIGTSTCDRNTELLNNYIKENNIKNFIPLTLNLNNTKSISEIVSYINRNIGTPLIIINNAGITSDNLFVKMTNTEWTEVININLTGTFLLTKACLKKMILSKWGRIINISSIVAFTGNAGQSNYAASKAGIIAMSKCLAKEIACTGITVNVIAPGFIDTDMTKNLNLKQKENILKYIPMKKLGTSHDIVNVVEFLISEKSSYITGETIHVNGGMFMN